MVNVNFNAKKITDELINWIREYFEKNATPTTKAVVGISGGKDSSVVTNLCVRALGKERVVGVLMPQGEQHDIDVSLKLCEHLDIQHYSINIKNAVDSLYTEIKKTGLTLNTIASFNTPARLRMTSLYAISAIVGGRVANTCNYSEDYVGYATKYGDGAGDFSPLSGLTVSEVKEIGRELGLPSMFVDKTPIDGLCGKTDEENLGFTYATLDRYINEGVCESEEVKAKIDDMYKKNVHKIVPMPKFEPDFRKEK